MRNAERSGIFLFAVDGFEVSGGNYIDNGEYGRFPRCSRDGLIAINSGGFGSSNNTVITRNVIRQNGRNPDPRTRGSGDIVYLDNPANGSCISDNVFKTSDEPFGEPPACS